MLVRGVEQAKRVLEDSRHIDDDAAYLSWQTSVDRWRQDTLSMLAQQFGREVVVEFALATSSARGRQLLTLRRQRRAVENGLELLTALHGTQTGRLLGTRNLPRDVQAGPVRT